MAENVNKMREMIRVRSLLELVQEAVSPWHTVQAVSKRLSKAGFQPLELE